MNAEREGPSGVVGRLARLLLPLALATFTFTCGNDENGRSKPADDVSGPKATEPEVRGGSKGPELGADHVPGRGEIVGRIALTDERMDALARNRPESWSTIVFLEQVPEEHWVATAPTHAGGVCQLWLTDDYIDVYWGRVLDGGWIASPATVVDLEVGEKVEIVFPERYLDRHLSVDFQPDVYTLEPRWRNDMSFGQRWPLYFYRIYLREPAEMASPTAMKERARWSGRDGTAPGMSHGPLEVSRAGGVMDILAGFRTCERVYIVCVQNPFHVAVNLGVDREFRLANVPPGDWWLRTFDGHFETKRQQVRVLADEVCEVELELSELKEGLPPHALSGEDPRPTTSRGLLERAIGAYVSLNVARAIEDLELAVVRDPDYWQAWAALGIAFARGGETEMAGAAFDRALSLAPEEWGGPIRERASARRGPKIDPGDVAFLERLRRE